MISSFRLFVLWVLPLLFISPQSFGKPGTHNLRVGQEKTFISRYVVQTVYYRVVCRSKDSPRLIGAMNPPGGGRTPRYLISLRPGEGRVIRIASNHSTYTYPRFGRKIIFKPDVRISHVTVRCTSGSSKSSARLRTTRAKNEPKYAPFVPKTWDELTKGKDNFVLKEVRFGTEGESELIQDLSPEDLNEDKPYVVVIFGKELKSRELASRLPATLGEDRFGRSIKYYWVPEKGEAGKKFFSEFFARAENAVHSSKSPIGILYSAPELVDNSNQSRRRVLDVYSAGEELNYFDLLIRNSKAFDREFKQEVDRSDLTPDENVGDVTDLIFGEDRNHVVIVLGKDRTSQEIFEKTKKMYGADDWMISFPVKHVRLARSPKALKLVERLLARPGHDCVPISQIQGLVVHGGGDKPVVTVYEKGEKIDFFYLMSQSGPLISALSSPYCERRNKDKKKK